MTPGLVASRDGRLGREHSAVSAVPVRLSPTRFGANARRRPTGEDYARETVAHAAAVQARRDVLFHRDALTVAVAATLFAGGVMFAALWGTSQLLDTSQIGLGSALTDAAFVIERDANALGPDRAADAATLRTLAARLRDDARFLGDHPEWNTNASEALLTSKVDQLDADANALAARGAAVNDPALIAAADHIRQAARMLSGAAERARGMMRR